MIDEVTSNSAPHGLRQNRNLLLLITQRDNSNTGGNSKSNSNTSNTSNAKNANGIAVRPGSTTLVAQAQKPKAGTAVDTASKICSIVMPDALAYTNRAMRSGANSKNFALLNPMSGNFLTSSTTRQIGALCSGCRPPMWRRLPATPTEPERAAKTAWATRKSSVPARRKALFSSTVVSVTPTKIMRPTVAV